MKKLRNWIEIWMDGGEDRGIKNVRRGKRYEVMDIYKGIVRKEHPEFINGKVKEILDKCGIKTVVEGIGWRVI